MSPDDAQIATMVQIRELVSMPELRPLEALQRAVWGIDDDEVVPATTMRAVVHAGGLVAGALLGGKVVGFTFGFLAAPHGAGMVGYGLHSHMAGVVDGLRGLGVGRKLKAHQAAWSRERGLGWISWTFDPLRAANAKFNIAVLGARCHDYLEDFYGAMPGALGGGVSSDRLLALWSVVGDEDSARVGAGGPGPSDSSASGDRMRRPAARGGEGHRHRALLTSLPAPTVLLPAGGEPAPVGSEEVEEALSLAITVAIGTPTDPSDVFSRRDSAEAWRRAQRSTLGVALQRGYVVDAFVEGHFVATRPQRRSTTLDHQM